MSSYYDDKKKKYVVSASLGAEKKEFPEQPGLMDRLKESFEDNNTRAQLEAIRKRRTGA